MTIPIPQADELVRGQIGRFRLATGRRSSDACIAAIRFTAGAVDSDVSILELLAQVSGIDTATYARQHSMLPFTAIASDLPTNDFKGAWSRSVLRVKGMRTPRKHAYLCPRCVAHDMSQIRYSYWRRGHQLPGAHNCIEHNEPLRFVEGLAAFSRQPAHVLELSKESPLARDHETLASQAVGRFQSMSQALLVTTLDVSEEHLRQALAKQAASQGMRVWIRGTMPLLSDVARSTFPTKWLAEIFDGIDVNAPGEFFSPIDNAVRPTATTTGTAYCLAMATLFHSAEQALENIKSCQLPNIDDVKAPARKKSPQQVYCDHRGRLDLVAAELGTSEDQVIRRLVRKRAALMRRLGDTAELRALRRFVTAGGLMRVCSEEGADVQTVESVIRLLIAQQGKLIQ